MISLDGNGAEKANCLVFAICHLLAAHSAPGDSAHLCLPRTDRDDKAAVSGKIVYLLLPFLVTFLNVQSVLINKSHLTAPAV